MVDWELNMVKTWKDRTSNVKKVSGIVNSAISFIFGINKSQYEKLSDEQRRLFDKLVVDRFGKKENICQLAAK